MPADGRPGLRNALEKAAAAIRKDPLDFDEFLARWRAGLEDRDFVWEGPLAVAELKQKEMYKFLRCEQAKFHGKILVDRMIEELNAYDVEAQGRLAKERFDDVDEFLRGLTGRIQAKRERTTDPSLNALLGRLKREVESAQKTVGTLKQQKRDWHFGAWRHFWPEIPRRNLVSRKLELDTRLQVELGKILAGYLRTEDKRERVSMETIARLILLAYLAGGLAEEEKGTGEIRTYATRRILTVRNVRDNLRNAGLHKAKSFRNRKHKRR